MSTTIESLELEIHSNSQSAVDGIDALTQSLNKLKAATNGGLGLKSIAKGLSDINAAISGITGDAVAHTQGLAKAIDLLNGKKISTTIAKQVAAINDALKNADFSGGEAKITELVQVLKPLETLGKSSFSSTVNALKKLPEAIAKIDTRALYNKIQSLTRIFKPLADEMEKIAKGFSAMPSKIQKLIKEAEKIPTANQKSSASFTDLYHKMKVGINTIKRVGQTIYSFVEKSMDYTENMNLFTVSMGEYASEAKEYAETVSDAMGIDTSDWIRSQGVFMTMATGFGVAGDRAATMSKNLTQLGYDLASFYNIDTETAMLKLKSGLAGELEPLRAIGYDLSQAKLEATALALGIDKSVSSMTQAEKAQLRYYAIMTQVTDAQGDMARTLDDPANQVRVLKAEFNMAAREIGNIFIPALNAIMPYAIAVTKVVGNLAQSIAGLFGYKAPELDNTTSQVVENTDAVSENLEDAQKEAKKLKSYMLGIDELNVINPDAGSASADASGSAFEFELPEYDFMEGLIESKVNSIAATIEESLAEIFSIVSGFSLAVGAVLAFSGINIPLGIALMAAGAVGLVTNTAINWSSMESPVEATLGTLTGLVGGALLATGAILAFTGMNIPLGIALMAGGAISLTTAFALNWDSLSEPVRRVIGTLEGIVGGALLSLGAVLAFTGVNIPMGIALMAVGAISLASAIALNWESLTGDIKGSINTLTMIVSGALLGVGAVLAFTGVNIPLGIALMSVGALTMGTSIALNANALSDEVKSVIAVITAAVSVALLAVGAILAFTGVNIPLGIALMAGGALLLASAVIPNWNYLAEALRGTAGTITAIVSGALLALGAILCFTGVGIPLGIALMAAGAAGLATVVAVNWNKVKETISTVLTAIGKILSGAMLALGVIMCLSGAGIGLGLALIFGSLSLSTKAWGTDDNPIINFVKKMVNGIVKIINWAIDGINEMFHIEFSGLTIGGVEIIPAFNKRLVNIPKIPMLAEGGFPEQGQMFIAREAGAEMVGNIGRRTAVANNDQIVAGIAGGVAEANEEQNTLLREQNSLLRAILEKDSGVYLDGKNLTNSVEKYQRERGRVLITGGVL